MNLTLRRPSLGTIRLLIVLGFALVLAACASAPSGPPRWRYAVVPFGEGKLRLGVRLRSSAVPDDAGAVIRTPEGGEARVRVYACGQRLEDVQRDLRVYLRRRLVRSEILAAGDAVAFSWRRAKASGFQVVHTAVTRHGPLLIGVSSTTLPLDEVTELVQRIRLELPIPLINGCIAICDGEQRPCEPEQAGAEGTLVP